MKVLTYEGLAHFKKKLDTLYANNKAVEVLSKSINDIKTKVENNTESLIWL